MTTMTPQEIVHELDKHIVGQHNAKRAVAIALRNRWRRQQVPEPLRHEITPKEATKFTEVGYVGRDVDTIMRDLVEISIKQTRESAMRQVRTRAEEFAEERILDALLPAAREVGFNSSNEREPADSSTRQKFRKKLREGDLDDREIELEVSATQPHMEILAPQGMEDLTQQLQGMFQNLSGGRKKLRKMTIKEAMRTATEEEAARLVNDDDLKTRALANAEQNGIVFLDEIDKITSRSGTQGADVSREGVQRDLLPLVEGTTVSTKYGMVKTDHVLFIASGAFHLSKPSDLIPELQGRLPIRVELESLSVDDFECILTSTDACLTTQYVALLKTEDIQLEFAPGSVRRLAEIAYAVNERTENIGARRLYTVMEKLLENISFDAGGKGAETIVIDAAYVDARLKNLAEKEDLARYVL